eukprot:27075-Amorphochlora_amoeboformis.AAC.4
MESGEMLIVVFPLCPLLKDWGKGVKLGLVLLKSVKNQEQKLGYTYPSCPNSLSPHVYRIPNFE